MTTRWNDSSQAVNDQFDICIFGTEATGKSSLILHFIKGYFIEQIDYCAEEVYTKIIPTDSGFDEYTILDTNTSELDYYASSKRKQIQNTLSMIFVYAINNRESFEVLEDFYYRIKTVREEMPPVIVVGLKSDLIDDVQVDYYEGKELSERIGALNFTECSALLNIGIDETFEPLINEINNVRELEALQKTDSDSVFSSRTAEDNNDISEYPIPATEARVAENKDETTQDKESEHFSDRNSKGSEDSRISFSIKETKTVTRNISRHKSSEKESSSKCCIIV